MPTPDVIPLNKFDTSEGSSRASSNRRAGQEQGRGAASRLAGQVRHQFGRLTQQGVDKATEYAGTGKDQIVTKLVGVADVLESVAGSAEQSYGPQAGDYVRQAAGRLSSFAEDLRGRSVEELFDDSRTAIQNNVGVAVGTAALIGFVAARIAKGGFEDQAPRSESIRTGEFA